MVDAHLLHTATAIALHSMLILVTASLAVEKRRRYQEINPSLRSSVYLLISYDGAIDWISDNLPIEPVSCTKPASPLNR